jgi:hypothetical protein
MNAYLTLAQDTLARKLGLSRQWIGELLARLQEAGWIEYYSPRTPDGLNASTIYRIGRQLKRLLVMLTKSRQKKPVKSPEEQRLFSSCQKSQPGYLRPYPPTKRVVTEGQNMKTKDMEVLIRLLHTYGFPTVLAHMSDFAFCQAIIERKHDDEEKAALYERLSLELVIAVRELNKKA